MTKITKLLITKLALSTSNEYLKTLTVVSKNKT